MPCVKVIKYDFFQVQGEVIATYAVCNFANIGSVGMNLGSFGALAPSRTSDLAKVCLWALLAGNMASFMTACIAGNNKRETSLNSVNSRLVLQQP